MDSKPYLGGFRDRRTNTVYHSAAVQAAVPPLGPPPPPPPARAERDAQTRAPPAARSSQAPRTALVQTAPNVRGVYLGPRDAGRTLTARPYEDAAAWLVRRSAAALVVQCGWRCAVARAALARARAATDARAAAAEAAAAAAAAAERDAEAARVARRTAPRTAADFAALYDEVEEWRAATTARIKAEVPPAGRTAAFSALLARETELLKNIDGLRAAAARGGEAAAAARRLAAIAEPGTWPLSHVPRAAREAAVRVETPFTTRAAELARLHAALVADAASDAARTEVLLHVKYTAAEFDCALTRELTALVDRELDQLARGRPAAALAGLRARVARAFSVFAEEPAFNPEAARAPRVPVGRAQATMGAMLRTAPLHASNVAARRMQWQANKDGSVTLGGGGGGDE
jgi:hypothetical protein